MKHILTPEEYIIRSVNSHPSLYASSSYDTTKFKVLDHLLNTIGNGLETESFVDESVSEDEMVAAQKWFNCTRAAYGYLKVKKLYENSDWVAPDGGPEMVVPVNEMNKHPEIVHWLEFDCKATCIPYPNFQKQYSAVWDKRDIQFTELGVEWAKAAKWYYSKCKEFFLDAELVKQYHQAFPKPTENETQRTIKDYQKFMTDTKRYPNAEEISRAYECEFIGDPNNDQDVSAFIVKLWKKEHQRIMCFIEETLTYTNNLI